ncbi:MAG: hypothetical protein HY820_36450 [Acidobacteria bacterium]|nr:hypothetical protein [Acidobacteriota bacterium]
MPDPTAPSVTLPMGVYETGEFAPAIDAATLRILKTRSQFGSVPKGTIEAKATSKDPTFGMVGGELGADILEKSGWAVMFGTTVSDTIKRKLQPLIKHRQDEVGNPALCPILDPPRPGQTAAQWLAEKHKLSLNVVAPEKGVPYYVMIVASPEDVSFDFQYELDLYWAVGRLWLESAAAFERYAESVIACENLERAPTARKIALFAPDYSGKDNGASKLVKENLIDPMVAGSLGDSEKFARQLFIGEGATKQTFHHLFTGAVDGGPPSILFTASHGLLKLPESPNLADSQGAVLCQEWQGQPPPLESYYASWDFPETPKVHGMVHFLFACYGLGWPKHDTFNYEKKVPIAPAPMMAKLPQKLLGAENGALAVLGHIDRAWSTSYREAGAPQEQGFVDVITKIMGGYRMGSATDQFNFRWAALTIPLERTLNQMRTRRGLEQLARDQWLMRDDARNYILHGDPAVKLKTSKKAMPAIG